MYTQDETIANLREQRKRLEDTLEAVKKLLSEWELGIRVAQMSEDVRSALEKVCNQLKEILESEG